jgi:CBS domain containing-hemolysin-like protein
MLVAILFVTIFVSCIFSGSETGIISWNRLKVAHAAAQGGFTARLAMRLLNSRGQLLSVTLIGNNICNILSTLIFAELFVQLNSSAAIDLSRIPSPESWFLTPVLLLFSEIIPKSLYRTYPFKLTMKSIPVLAVVFFALSPLFWLFGVASKAFGRTARRGGLDEGANVREEIVLVAVEGARRGNIFDSADNIMKNTLEMKGKRIEEIAIGFDEWKKSRAVYRSSQMITELRSGGADVVVVFDDNLSAPTGYVSLLDIAAHRGGDGGGDLGMKTFGSLMKPLPCLKSGMEILACLRHIPPDSFRYYLIADGDAATGILDKMALFETAFAGV